MRDCDGVIFGIESKEGDLLGLNSLVSCAGTAPVVLRL